MNARPKRFKLIVLLSCCVIGVAILWLGWQFWMIQGQLSLIHWVTADGGLEINHMPGKRQVYLQVNPSYSSQAERVWIKYLPGATERWIGRIEVPPPEELFKRARMHINNDSNLDSLCRFYPNATRQQQLDIESHVNNLLDEGRLLDDARNCFDHIMNK